MSKRSTDFFVCASTVIIGIFLFILIVYYESAFAKEDVVTLYLGDTLILILFISLIFLSVYLVIKFIKIYNIFKVDRNAADSIFGQINIAMKKRLDLIEQLFFIVKSYAKFEQDTIIKVTSLRSLSTSDSHESLDRMESVSHNILWQLIAVIENYPNLKTNEIVQSLTTSIQGNEEEIAQHRYAYNALVKDYNIRVKTIPTNIVAVITGFKKLDYLIFEESITKTPSIEF
jgi:LemA protein